MTSVLRLVVADLIDFVVSEWRTVSGLPQPAAQYNESNVEVVLAAFLSSPGVHTDPQLLVGQAPTLMQLPATVPLPTLEAAGRLLSLEAGVAAAEPSVPRLTVPDYTEATLPLPTVDPVFSLPNRYPTYMYVCEPLGAALLKEAHIGFDTLLCTVSYGQLVSVRSFSGAYAEVVVYGQTGYLHKDALTPQKDDIWPALESKCVYTALVPATKLVRTLLGDPFMAGRLELPLQAGEYILFRLKQDGATITWPLGVRPRLPGQWYQILRGVRGIHTGVIPLTDCVMEWQAEDGEGRLAYVEAVLPDKTLRISTVGLVVAGEYSEVVLPEAVWREWRPVFIEVA